MAKASTLIKGKWLATAALGAVSAFASSAHAQTTLYSSSFEPPTYTAGATAVGIDGWVAGSSSGASQTVSTLVAHTGTQSLVFDNTGTNTSFYSIYHPLGAFGTNTVTLNVNLYVPSTNGADRLGEIAFSTGTLGGTVLGLSIDGAGDIRLGNSWSALYSATTIFATAPAGTYANRWLTATLTFNPTSLTGTATISGFGGATSSYSSNFSVTTAPTNVNLGTDYLTTTARLGRLGYDDVLISAVPEPSTVAASVLGLGLLGTVVRRRAFRRAA